jgi:hypothetical protein
MCARGALAAGDVPALGRALERISGERELEVELVRALGASGDPRALAPLEEQLASVRTRVEVVQALGALGDVRAVALIARWMPAEPYISARAEMVRLLGRLAPRDPSGEARRALVALSAVEREPSVARALAEALAGDGAAVSPPSR